MTVYEIFVYMYSTMKNFSKYENFSKYKIFSKIQQKDKLGKMYRKVKVKMNV